jgi:type I restriction enzyme S subunit
MGEGSTNQTELSARKLGEEIKIFVPPKGVMLEFEKDARNIFGLIWNLQKQNTKLREARDILLPKLMNGQIEV